VAHRHLRFHTVQSGGRTVVSIERIADPVSGDRVPDVTDLRGISFRVPDVSRTVIEVQGSIVDHHVLGHGRGSGGYIGIPWEIT
jgi:hypothetical protein